ncbi:MAG TPA: SufE family protein [Chthoniobacter sp.]|nr:SufE family protein [Chthoniobacter sp.]
MPSLAEKQQQLIARYRIIEDSHERLAAVVARGKKWPTVTEDQRTEANRVPGCSSRVWLVGRIEEGLCHFQMDADSPLVKGLVALLCELYEGASLDEIVSVEPEIFSALHLDRQLSPTRLNGLAGVRAMIRAFAESQLSK